MPRSENTANALNGKNLKPVVYAISAVGRGFDALTFATLKEPQKYPSTPRRELREIMQKLPLVPERGPAQP